MEKIKKSDITRFAKDCAYAHKNAVMLMCISEDISRSTVGKELINFDDEELLLKVSRRFAKFATEEMHMDVNVGEVQNTQDIINDIISCCEENNWFEGE